MITKCQCQNIGDVGEHNLHLYDAVTERPFVNHAPGECKCTNGIKLYQRDDEKLWLCSVCCLIGDTEIES